MMQKLQMKKGSSHIWVISIPSQAPQVTILCGRQRQEKKNRNKRAINGNKKKTVRTNLIKK